MVTSDPNDLLNESRQRSERSYWCASLKLYKDKTPHIQKGRVAQVRFLNAIVIFKEKTCQRYCATRAWANQLVSERCTDHQMRCWKPPCVRTVPSDRRQPWKVFVIRICWTTAGRAPWKKVPAEDGPHREHSSKCTYVPSCGVASCTSHLVKLLINTSLLDGYASASGGSFWPGCLEQCVIFQKCYRVEIAKSKWG